MPHPDMSPTQKNFFDMGGGTPGVVPSKFYLTIHHYLSIGAISFPLSIQKISNPLTNYPYCPNFSINAKTVVTQPPYNERFLFYRSEAYLYIIYIAKKFVTKVSHI